MLGDMEYTDFIVHLSENLSLADITIIIETMYVKSWVMLMEMT